MCANGNKVEVLPHDGATAYLGRALSLSNTQEVELQNRLDAAWKKFHANKAQLCNKNYPLLARLKLFNAVVTPTALYGCETWTMLQEGRRRLQSSQRRMLRWMVGVGRHFRKKDSDTDSDTEEPSDANESTENSMEPFTDWIQRVTHIAESQMQKAGLKDWATLHTQRKWDWAGRLARFTDERLSQKILLWIPENGQRSVGSPHKRWTDDIGKICHQVDSVNCNSILDWYVLAQDVETWERLQEHYVKFAVDSVR